MRIRHLWYHRGEQGGFAWRGAFLEARPCDPAATVAQLSTVPQPELGWFSRVVAILTTPFKFLGISGWTDTGCAGRGRGRLIRDAQHSTDGFWTIDLSLDGFTIGGMHAPYGRFLRLECEPGTEAHRVCSEGRLRAEQDLRFGGPIVVDTDGPFLEIHPDGELEIIEKGSRESRVASRAGNARSVIASERSERGNLDFV